MPVQAINEQSHKRWLCVHSFADATHPLGNPGPAGAGLGGHCAE